MACTRAPSGRMTPSPAGATDYEGEASPPSGTFKAVSAGGYHTCGTARMTPSSCWGDNKYGQVNGLPLYSPRPSGTFKAVSAGVYHLCHPGG